MEGTSIIRNPARTARRLALLIVVGGLLLTSARIVQAADHGVVWFNGKLDSVEVLRSAVNPREPDPRPHLQKIRYGYLDAAEGTMRMPADTGEIVPWAAVQLAPWLLAESASAYATYVSPEVSPQLKL